MSWPGRNALETCCVSFFPRGKVSGGLRCEKLYFQPYLDVGLCISVPCPD